MTRTVRFERLRDLLLELFQLDKPDLDFGIYRIMHARSREVTQFLEKDLLPQVREAFAEYRAADRDQLEKELAEAERQAASLGLDPDLAPKVQALRGQLEEGAATSADLDSLEADVYDHLYRFFRRYYDDGDFLSKRVYKDGVYAIPYSGEEVKLHWANADQYYIKTDEYLRNYTFRLRPENDEDPMRVHFRLVDAAEGEHDNVKASASKKRLFVLDESPSDTDGSGPLSLEKGEGREELVIGFEYRPVTMADWPAKERRDRKRVPDQKALNEIAEGRILDAAKGSRTLRPWLQALHAPHILSDGTKADYSRLRSHLDRYTARNTFDYFIHKDLGGFLRRELDFYIKNEVMHLDDIENEDAPRVEQYLSKVKVIRQIAHELIAFLAQLEDFQKELWLKKKFVIETRWLVRLGVIADLDAPLSDALLAEIAANDAQREEWVELCEIGEVEEGQPDRQRQLLPDSLRQETYSEPLTVDFLRQHPTLMIDTKHFDHGFTGRLLATLADLDEMTDGVLVHGDNFHALELIKERYASAVDFTYIDPPYNTDATPILYKNDYKESSWLALMADRLSLGLALHTREHALCVAIDDAELAPLSLLLKEIYAEYDLFRVVVKHYPGSGTGRSNVTRTHEYALFAVPSHLDLLRGERVDSGKRERGFRRSGTGENNYRTGRHNSFYAVLVDAETLQISGVERPPLGDSYPRDRTAGGLTRVYPIGEDGSERVWTLSYEGATAAIQRRELRCTRNMVIRRVYDDAQRRNLLPSLWTDAKFSAVSYGTNLLTRLFGTNAAFSYPKSLHTVTQAVDAATYSIRGPLVADYFAGSGTTGHSVICLNREDGGARKFILVEAAQHFETVLVPRLKKVTYSPEWKNGKPTRKATDEEASRSPRIMKVVRIESYEDTLNNLHVTESAPPPDLPPAPAGSVGSGSGPGLLPAERGASAWRDPGDGAERGNLSGAPPDGELSDAVRLGQRYPLRYLLDIETRGSRSLLDVGAFLNPDRYQLRVRRPGSDESHTSSVDLVETFNWLLGLRVRRMHAPERYRADVEADGDGCFSVIGSVALDLDGPWQFRAIEGDLPDGRSALVIWRNRPGGDDADGLARDNAVLEAWFRERRLQQEGRLFDVVWVNGDQNLQRHREAGETWEVRLVEADFHRRMFSE